MLDAQEQVSANINLNIKKLKIFIIAKKNPRIKLPRLNRTIRKHPK
jgi:hypothetical protein